MQILLANPRGFCAGVDRAISIVENALEFTARRFMCVTKWCTTATWSTACASGAIFIEQISEVPDGAILIFRARRLSGGT
jgi:4-hydroxy-3-methylbut-2-enyl diphosphate reductase